MFAPWIKATQHGISLYIVIQPKASKNEIVGPFGDPPRLKIRIAAPPVEGEANEALLKFLSKTLKLPKSQLQLVRGRQSKQKEILCIGQMNLTQIFKALLVQ